MKVVGMRKVRLSSLRLPAGFRRLLHSLTTVGEDGLARSLLRVGQLDEPTVRVGTFEVLDGLDLVAAAFRNDSGDLRVRLVDCTDAEADLVKAEAGNQRRRNLPAEREEILADIARQEKMLDEGAIVVEAMDVKRGRPKGKHTLAIERIAAMRGVTPAAIRKHEARTRKRRQAAEAEGEPLPPPLETLGMELDPVWAESVRTIQAHMDKMLYSLRTCTRAISEIEAMKDAVPEAVLQRIQMGIHDLRAEITSYRPESICPYCRGVDELQKKCVPCVSLGWLSRREMAKVPRELLDKDVPRVLVGQQVRPLSDFVETDEAPFGMES